MNNVVKYYYSEPLYQDVFVYNPYLDCMMVTDSKPLRRYTMAVVYDESDHTIKFGVSICMPNDNFCKKVGQEIAYQNAMTKPFYQINDFNGIRNDYADDVMQIVYDKEVELCKKHYPAMFNVKNKFD